MNVTVLTCQNHKMNNQEPQISLSTLIEVSPLIGFPFGKNSTIRDAQDIDLVLDLQKASSVSIDTNKGKDFFFGTLDFLPYDDNGKTQFKFLEFSGTGSGGISNISFFAINSVLDEFAKIPHYINNSTPLILLAYTDSQSLSNSTPRKFVFERFFFAESMKNGLKEKYGSAIITTLPEILEKNEFDLSQPTIIIGFLKDFIKYLHCKNNKLFFFDQPVSCLFNDTLCNNAVKTFKGQFNPEDVYTINSIYPLSADKRLSYTLFNDFISTKSFENIDQTIKFTVAKDKDDLINKVFTKTQAGEKVVIKPYAGSVGMGVEFFLEPEAKDVIITKVDESIRTIEKFQGINNWSFPYTISEFVDYYSIKNEEHTLNNHKFELRVIVYRENNILKAFPSVVRVATLPYDTDNFDKLMLLSYASLGDSKITVPKYKFLMPLSNTETLNLLNIKFDELQNLCSFSTNFINYAINNL